MKQSHIYISYKKILYDPLKKKKLHLKIDPMTKLKNYSFESSKIVFRISHIKQSNIYIYISYKKMEPCSILLKKKIFENRSSDEIKKLFESSEIVFGISRVKQSHIYILYKKMEPCFIPLKKKLYLKIDPVTKLFVRIVGNCIRNIFEYL